MKRAYGCQDTRSSAPSADSPPAEAFKLSASQKAVLLRRAREAIACHLRSEKLPALENSDPTLRRATGVFITLRTIPQPDGSVDDLVDPHPDGPLRGCVGRMQADLPLLQAVQEIAVRSATRDPRFPSLELDELANTRIEISLLTPLTLVTDVRLIEVGRHGLVMESDSHRGVLLPNVAVTRGWNREQFITYTCRKAGLPPGSWPGRAKLYLFEAVAFAEWSI